MMGPYLEHIRALIGNQCLQLPGVSAIILDDGGRVLLQHRTDVDFWCLPAGSLELDETALDALKREVREETGLEVLHAEPMALYSGPSQRFRYPHGDEVQCFAIAFIVRDWNGKPRADGREGSEVRFWEIDSLPVNLVPIHAAILNDYQQYRGQFMLPE
jgi:ADP-ribose pyrophosphatase YjhB (NUDIX family)